LVEAASFALVQRNHALALDLIAQLDNLTKGREAAVPMPGPFWKLKIFRQHHLGHADEAHAIIERASRWKDTCPFHHLDILAAQAWLEQQESGCVSEKTQASLLIFNRFDAKGRRDLFRMQGFLAPDVETNCARPQETASNNPQGRKNNAALL
jgi:hypothetical protein